MDGSEAGQLAAVASLPRDVQLMKMENEQFMAIARLTPRKPGEIIAQLQELVDAYPDSASEAIYSKPVGNVRRVECGNQNCGHTYDVGYKDTQFECPRCESKNVKSNRIVKKFAEGLSVRSAESIRSIYGSNRMRTDTELMDDGKVKITGVFVDYATGTITEDARIVSPFYKARNGGMEKTPEDRFLNVVVKSEKSKLRRDVILDSIPNFVKAAYRDMCQRKLDSLLTPEYVQSRVLPAFAQYGITLQDLEKIIGRPMAMGWTNADRAELLKIITALKNEETTVAEILRDENSPQQGQPNQSAKGPSDGSGASASDLTGGKASKTERPHKKEKEPEKPKEEARQPDYDPPQQEAIGFVDREIKSCAGNVGNLEELLKQLATDETFASVRDAGVLGDAEILVKKAIARAKAGG